MIYIRGMNVATLDLNLLVALDALLQEESVGRGGQKIGLSQPAMRDALERVHEVFVSDSFVAASSSRTFRIFMSDYASSLLLSSLSKAVQQGAPRVRIEVHPWRGVPADSGESGRIPEAGVAATRGGGP